MKTLFVRFDRLGDLVLTLPVDQHPGVIADDATWLIPKGLEFVLDLAVPKRKHKSFSKEATPETKSEILTWLRAQHFDHAVVFHAPWWLTHLLWKAKIPVRVGRRSQWHSYLFFNRGIRQKRSLAEHHERDYNYLLLEQALNLESEPAQWTTLKMHAELSSSLQALLPARYIVVHPGMGGSARNWPTEHYANLIRELVTQNKDVVITGTAADREWTTPLQLLFAASSDGATSQGSRVHWFNEKLNGVELVAVLAHAEAVVAPSTGVLHVAASTGVQTLGIFSPVRVQAAQRWGPLGEHAESLTPQVTCPGTLTCLGPACPFYDCMPQITPHSITQELNC